MSASPVKPRQLRRTLLVYGALTLFCGLFSFVYELFSHGVYSPFMVCLFLFPLCGGLVTALLLWTRHIPSRAVCGLFNAAVATFAVGSALRGVLDIYGTSSDYIPVYWWAGGVLLITAIALDAVAVVRAKRNTK